jgi:dTDP-4-dehydrorhamnose 3,5-epimerase
MNDGQDYISETDLAGVVKISRPTFPDPRGFFRETYRKNDLDNKLGFAFEPVQANHSRSQQNTLRGIHRAPWHKLITVTSGEVQAVIVDLREDSPTFGQHASINIGEGKACSIFVPAYCGNSFLVLSNQADYVYLVTDYWAPGKELSVMYNDSDLNILWQTSSPIVSEKDLQNPAVRELFPDKFNS